MKYFLLGFIISFAICQIVIFITKYFLKRRRQKMWDDRMKEIKEEYDDYMATEILVFYRRP